MRRRNTELLKDVIYQFLKQQHLDIPLLERKLVSAWPVVLGDNIKQYTTEIYVKNKILFVKLSSSVLRHDLFISKENIIKSLNQHVGAEVIQDIIFR